ncbi:MAG: hypothetical protein ACTSPZ_01585 [Promethearchaeota archaeon]
MEIGSPGKSLFFFNPEIVIPVPITIATVVKAVIIILFVNNSTLEVSKP